MFLTTVVYVSSNICFNGYSYVDYFHLDPFCGDSLGKFLSDLVVVYPLFWNIGFKMKDFDAITMEIKRKFVSLFIHI